MKLRFGILVFWLFIINAGCASFNENEVQKEFIDKLSWIEDADPQSDFWKAVEKNDYRFIALYGYSSYVPGVPKGCIPEHKDRNHLEGTSDAIANYRHARLIAIATAYAEHYNVLMKFHLHQKGELNCYSKIKN